MDFVYLHICVPFTREGNKNKISNRSWCYCYLYRLDKFYLVFKAITDVWYLRHIDKQSFHVITQGNILFRQFGTYVVLTNKVFMSLLKVIFCLDNSNYSYMVGRNQGRQMINN